MDTESRTLPATIVGAGGALGALARYGITQALPGGYIDLMAVNVSGAFLLGLLTYTLAGKVADPSKRRRWQLFAGTGVLGGFTTYSALALDTVHLTHSPALAFAYAAGTVVLGVLAAWLGSLAGERIGGTS
ncbi:CrcB protein [Arcanobacterium wilhelmae]|uniref:Fluoride-specific ion channel FluC n=1 Tax=Arcanobacterium wilhelmae TaxID=1803177 RepID=A0ABT9N919_9ACTO|nr:CrcB family protein [Arcanobacterium wilhelmae]MDP9800202.1 CrcB protein [Arcanobacterium wilhelmae]WFN89643.1 CrcB family protein [Arcanobacterium wilhelmae]